MTTRSITFMTALIVLSLVIFPSPALAEEDTLLTPYEKSFTLHLALKISRAKGALSGYRSWVNDSRMLLTGSIPESKLFAPTPRFEECMLSSNIPDTMDDIADTWNVEICNEFGEVSQKIESYSQNTIPGRTLDLVVISSLLNDIEKSLAGIEGMAAKRIDELTKVRKAKEAEKEAKKDLGLKDDFCFIATAAYGTPAAVEINVLRRFRDEYLRTGSYGNDFIKFYYENSPPVARFISEHEILRVIVRAGFVDPVVRIVELTENFWAEQPVP